MDQKTKQLFFTFLYIVMLVTVIATCIFMMGYITDEGGKCLTDPIEFYSEKTEQICYCGDESDIFLSDNFLYKGDINFTVIP